MKLTKIFKRIVKKIYLEVIQIIWRISWVFSKFNVQIQEKFILLEFTRFGKKNCLYLPKKNLMKHRAFLYKGSEVIEITHPYGIPYFVSANDLGGDKIVINLNHSNKSTNLSQRPQVLTFVADQIPQF